MKYTLYFLFGLLVACHSAHENKGRVPCKYVYPDKEWSHTDLNISGATKARFDSLAHVFDEKFSLLLIKDGEIIYENYQSPYLRDSLIHVNSCTKNVVSLLFGMVFKNDLITHENRSSLSYFPEYQINDPAIQNIKNKHFLSMDSGLEWRGGVDATDVLAMSESEDWAKYVFERAAIYEPGTHYNYNSGGSQVIATILHKQVAGGLERYAADSLFRPLGIERFVWDKTLNGVPKAGWGLHLTMGDLGKLGYLMLRGGVWNDIQLIPDHWVDKVASPQVEINDTWNYGYQFWIPRDSSAYKSYLFRGYYPPSHKIVEVIPELDMVAVYVGENSDFKTLITSYIEALDVAGQ